MSDGGVIGICGVLGGLAIGSIIGGNKHAWPLALVACMSLIVAGAVTIF